MPLVLALFYQQRKMVDEQVEDLLCTRSRYATNWCTSVETSRISMDRMPPSEGGDAGSIPAERTRD